MALLRTDTRTFIHTGLGQSAAETPIPVQDPGIFQCKTGLLLANAVNTAKKGFAYPSSDVVGPQAELEHFAEYHLRVEAAGLMRVPRVAVTAEVE